MIKYINIITNLLLFIGFGLLLSFTPCVLPMIPILSGLILQSGSQNKKKPFFLSLNYILGMCFLYFTVEILCGFLNPGIGNLDIYIS